MKILYACYGKAGLDCLYHLLNQEECAPESMLVITYSDAGNRPLIEHLDALRIPYTTDPIKDRDVLNRVREFVPDYLFSIYFRDIIGKEILQAVKHASVNLHPSLLPDYKGCFSAPWVLINGESKTGITYHVMEKNADSGAIFLQKELQIREWDTAFSLYHRLIALGVENFPTMFRLVVREGFNGTQQASGGRCYKRQIPYGGYFSLDWKKGRIHNFIRAMYFPPFDGAKLNFENEDVEFKTSEEFEVFCIKKRFPLNEK